MATQLSLPGLLLIESKIFKDDRGFFTEHYKKDSLSQLGIPDFVQDNRSRSKPGVIRGLHYQIQPEAQGKLVSVIRGAIWDVVVDLRKSSPTFGKWEAVELSDQNALQLWIPAGFAHGFCVLGDADADVFYKVDRPYSPTCERGIAYNDPTLQIKWPISNPIVSDKDRKLPLFSKDLSDFS